MKGVGLPTGLSCPQCNKKLNIKVGKNGHFLACNGYPDCTYSRDYIRDEKGKLKPIEPSPDEISIGEGSIGFNLPFSSRM